MALLHALHGVCRTSVLLRGGSDSQKLAVSDLKVHARDIFDSRRNPTVEVHLYISKGLFPAAVPSGASTGISKALGLRDDDKTRYVERVCLKD